MKAEFGIMMPSLWQEREHQDLDNSVKKPDLDNLLKLVKDGCSGVVYLDDNSIVMVTARRYSAHKEKRRLVESALKNLKNSTLHS